MAVVFIRWRKAQRISRCEKETRVLGKERLAQTLLMVACTGFWGAVQ
jgi:hypothetical protein